MGNTYIRTREDMVREFRGEKRRRPERQVKGHFQIRLSIAAFLFLLFFAAQELELSYQGIGNETVVGQISENEDLSFWQGKILSVFKNLNQEKP